MVNCMGESTGVKIPPFLRGLFRGQIMFPGFFVSALRDCSVLGPLERYITPTLDAALLSSSRAGADLGRTLDVESMMLVEFGVIVHND